MDLRAFLEANMRIEFVYLERYAEFNRIDHYNIHLIFIIPPVLQGIFCGRDERCLQRRDRRRRAGNPADIAWPVEQMSGPCLGEASRNNAPSPRGVTGEAAKGTDPDTAQNPAKPKFPLAIATRFA
jgi:hypothetical protein